MSKLRGSPWAWRTVSGVERRGEQQWDHFLVAAAVRAEAAFE